MHAFTYQAARICEKCAESIIEDLTAHGRTDSEDSETWPQGPDADGGGESDTPQHCDRGADCLDALACPSVRNGFKVGVFLKNPLTGEGMDYARERLIDPSGTREVKDLWREFYGLDDSDNWPTLRFSCYWSEALDVALRDRLIGIYGNLETDGFQNGYEMAAHADTDQDLLCDSFAIDSEGFGKIEHLGGDAQGRMKKRFSNAGLRAFVRWLLESDLDTDPCLDRKARDGEDWQDSAHSLASAICTTLAIELI